METNNNPNSNFLSKLKLGTDNIKIIKWPGTNTEVALKILSEQDRMEISIATEHLLKQEKVENNFNNSDIYTAENFCQMLYRVLRSPDNLDTPICSSISTFRKSLTREDTKVLVAEYLAFESECSPAPENLSSSDFDALLLRVKKNATETISSITSISLLKKLLAFTVNPPVNLPQGNGLS
jgi:hypothetical protein